MTASLLAATAVSGVLNGSLYALLALAVILVYRATAVANFAQGELGMLSVFVFLMYVAPLGWPVWLAWIATILMAGAIGGAVFLVLIRPRPRAGHLNLTVRTLGIYTLVSATAVFLWGGNEPYRLPHLFREQTIAFAGLSMSYDQIGTLGIVVLAGFLLLLLFRFTETGLAMRACAMNPEVASLLGINVRLMTTTVWVLAGMLGALAALLATSISFLDTASMRPYIVKALTAATMGGLQSFPGAIVGGLILGVVEALAAVGVSVNAREPLIFAVLLFVLLVRPAGIFGRRELGRV